MVVSSVNEVPNSVGQINQINTNKTTVCLFNSSTDERTIKRMYSRDKGEGKQMKARR